MKSRQLLKAKSLAHFSMTRKFEQSAELIETKNSLNMAQQELSEQELAQQSFQAQEVTPRLDERVPKITNQTLKNWIIVGALIFLSIVLFFAWFIVTLVLKAGATKMIGPGILIARG